MVSLEAIRTAVGILGNIIALALFMSPVPTFIKIWKKGAVEQFSPAPYLATLLNCMLWTLYGLPLVHPHSMLVITINGSGSLIELIYVLLFIYFSNGKQRIRLLAILFIEFIFVAVVAVFVLNFAHTYERRSLIVGSIAMIFCILMYVAPLAVLKMVIRTRSVEYMPLSLSLASFANAVCWTVYALIRFDLFITIPNSLGALFGVVQLILYAAFYKSTKRQIEERKLQGGELTGVTVMNGGDQNKMNNRGTESRET